MKSLALAMIFAFVSWQAAADDNPSTMEARYAASELYEITSFLADRIQRDRSRLESQMVVSEIHLAKQRLVEAAEQFDQLFFEDLKSGDGSSSQYADYSDCSSAARALSRYAETIGEAQDPFAGAVHFSIYSLQVLDCQAELGLIPNSNLRSVDVILPEVLNSYKEGATLLTELLDPKTLPPSMATSNSRNALSWAIVIEALLPARKTSWELAYIAKTSEDGDRAYQHGSCFSIDGAFEKLAGTYAEQISDAKFPRAAPADVEAFITVLENCEASIGAI